MGAGDHEVVSSAEEKLFQDFREREVEKLAVEHGFHSGISARHGVADDNDIRGGDILGTEPFDDGHAFGGEERGHRRIDFDVLPGDGESPVVHGRCDGAHGGSTNAEKMDVPDGIAHQ